VCVCVCVVLAVCLSLGSPAHRKTTRAKCIRKELWLGGCLSLGSPAHGKKCSVKEKHCCLRVLRKKKEKRGKSVIWGEWHV
jgi:hypothetical protein